MADWIKVAAEHMPPDDEPVFVTVHYKDGNKPMDKKAHAFPVVKYSQLEKQWYWFTENGWRKIWSKWAVTHWMPHPEPAQD